MLFKLLEKHFLVTSNPLKRFNKNTINLSYCCQENVIRLQDNKSKGFSTCVTSPILRTTGIEMTAFHRIIFYN